MITPDMRPLKKASVRLLIVLCEAEEPMSDTEAHLAIGKTWKKLYDARAFKEARDDLFARNWVNVELSPTVLGRKAYAFLVEHKDTNQWKKFFEPCSSPNVDDKGLATITA